MTRLRAFAGFLREFVIGDDWRVAAGVVVALAVTAGIADTSIPAWWILPVAVLLVLGVSLWRVAGPHGSARR